MRILMRFLGGMSERIFAVVLAISAAQFPIYYAAYSNVVAGAKAEAQSRYEELVREASALQLDVEAFVRRHEGSDDAVFRASGRIHRTTLDRFRHFDAMNAALRETPAWRRPMTLFENYEQPLNSAMHFEPGLPLTAEGGIYALIGLALAWLFTAILRAATGLMFPARAAGAGRQ